MDQEPADRHTNFIWNFIVRRSCHFWGVNMRFLTLHFHTLLRSVFFSCSSSLQFAWMHAFCTNFPAQPAFGMKNKRRWEREQLPAREQQRDQHDTRRWQFWKCKTILCKVEKGQTINKIFQHRKTAATTDNIVTCDSLILLSTAYKCCVCVCLCDLHAHCTVYIQKIDWMCVKIKDYGFFLFSCFHLRHTIII